MPARRSARRARRERARAASRPARPVRGGHDSRSLHLVSRGALDVRRTEGAGLRARRARPGDASASSACSTAAAHRPPSSRAGQRDAARSARGRSTRCSRASRRRTADARRAARLLIEREGARHPRQLDARAARARAHPGPPPLAARDRLPARQVAESRDPETGRHITRMSRVSARLAEVSGMSPAELRDAPARRADARHRQGRRARLDPPQGRAARPGEWETMRRHTTVGAEILTGSRSPIVQMAEEIALTHHERWDGSGYPRGLRGDGDPAGGPHLRGRRDVFDALVSARPYKPRGRSTKRSRSSSAGPGSCSTRAGRGAGERA